MTATRHRSETRCPSRPRHRRHGSGLAGGGGGVEVGGELGDLVAETIHLGGATGRGFDQGLDAGAKSVFIGDPSLVCADSTPRFSSPPGAAKADDRCPIRIFRWRLPSLASVSARAARRVFVGCWAYAISRRRQTLVKQNSQWTIWEMDRIGYACATPPRRGRGRRVRWHSPAPWSTMRPRKGQIHGSEKGNRAVDGVGRRTRGQGSGVQPLVQRGAPGERLAIPDS